MDERSRSSQDTQDFNLLEDRFTYENRIHVLRLTEDGRTCSWSPVDGKCDSKSTYSVDLADVLAVRDVDSDHYYLLNEHLTKKKSKSHSSSVMDISQVKKCYSFEVHFAVRRESKSIVKRAVFCNSDLAIVTKWVGRLRQRVESLSQRPKNLLVFLNPYGGRKKAPEIYEKYAEPLFRLANIKVNLLVTQRANHAYSHLVENGWPNVDGIVCVGGDGTFSEVMNGILARAASDENLDLDDSSVAMPAPEVRIGIIPAGSTDTIVYSLHGTSDVTTSVIHIITGNFLKTDVCSVHSEKKYLCCFISIMSYGYLGDVIKNSLSLRWMGPIRYDCAGAGRFICHRSYEGTVSFLRETNADQPLLVCSKNDCYCGVADAESNADNDQKWELIRGKFFMVTAANISCACNRSPNGIAPHCHFSDGYLYLLLIRQVSFCEKVKLLLTLSNSSKRKLVLCCSPRVPHDDATYGSSNSVESSKKTPVLQNNLDFVEIYKTRRFKFETGFGSGVIPATKISSWNIDGELISTPHLYVRCHSRAIRLFCRRRTSERSHLQV